MKTIILFLTICLFSGCNLVFAQSVQRFNGEQVESAVNLKVQHFDTKIVAEAFAKACTTEYAEVYKDVDGGYNVVYGNVQIKGLLILDTITDKE